jgi:hypothetical protein
MANKSIGVKAAIGPVRSRPMSSAGHQPHWKTATRAPKAAAMAIRFMIAAFRGTRIDRKAAMRSRKLSRMTPPKNQGSRSVSLSVRSTPTAASPPAWISRPSPSAGSMMSSRRWWTSSSVLSSCGAYLPITWITAAVGFAGSLGITGLTLATPGSAASWDASA